MLFEKVWLFISRLSHRLKGHYVPVSDEWYSTVGVDYHNNRHCTLGMNIEVKHGRAGTGDMPLCEQCAQLNRTSLTQSP